MNRKLISMITEVYSAFRNAGVPEDDARLAAEVLSEERLAIKDDIMKLDKELLRNVHEII